MSRRSDAVEWSYIDLWDQPPSYYYDNRLSFEGPGDWSGQLPRGTAYASYADDRRIGGAFQLRGDRYGDSTLWLESTKESSLNARIMVTDGALLQLTYSASGQGDSGGGGVGSNATFTITSVETGAIVFSLSRDGVSTYRGNGEYEWRPQVSMLELARGSYDIRMSVERTFWGGGHNTTWYAFGALEADIAITPIPVPATCAALVSFAPLMRRRRRDRF